MNLYRVAHVYRATPGAAPQEKALLIVAESQEDAAAFVNAKPGCEVTGVTVEKPNVQLASSVTSKPRSLESPGEATSNAPPASSDKLLTLVRNGRQKLSDIE